MVQASELEQPERDLVLTTRAPDDADVQEALRALVARIEQARTLEPTMAQRHCADCFHKGRDAAIHAILGEHD